MATLTIILQTGLPVIVSVALVCGGVKKRIEQKRAQALEYAQSRKRFEFFRID